MKLFNKSKQKQSNNENDFSSVQKISGGNLYEIRQRLEAQRQIDLNNLENIDFNQYFTDFEIQDYFLLQLQANYFINVIQYKIDDPTIYSQIKTLLRCAFINGHAGFFKDTLTNEWRVYYINELKTDKYGNVKGFSGTPYQLLNGITSPEALKSHKEIKEDIDENFIILKWGSAGLSAWLYIWPFIKFQNSLLSMIQSDSFSYIKKYIMDIVDPKQVDIELREWFNPKNPFIKKAKNIDLANKFKVVETGSHSNGKDVVGMYKDICGVYYSLYGRRWNNDFKKERSITTETDLTTTNYEILEKDWIDEFKIFMEAFNKLSDVKLEYIENDPLGLDRVEYTQTKDKNNNGGDNNDL